MDKQIWHIEKHRSRHTNNLNRDVTCRVRWIWFEVSIQSVDGTHNIPMQSIESVVIYWSIYSKMQLKSFYIICLFYVQTYVGNINIKLAILGIFNIHQAYKLDFKQRSHVFAPLSVPLDHGMIERINRPMPLTSPNGWTADCLGRRQIKSRPLPPGWSPLNGGDFRSGSVLPKIPRNIHQVSQGPKNTRLWMPPDIKPADFVQLGLMWETS